MEEIEIEKNNTPVIRKAKILCAADFSLDSYCVIVDGIYYLLNKNKLEQCEGVALDVFPEKAGFNLILESPEINLKKLKKFADEILIEESQKLNELKHSSGIPKAPTPGLRVGTVPIQPPKEKFEGRTPHQLLEIYEHAVNKNLKDSPYKLDANSHSLVDEKTKFKVEFHADGSTRSDLYSELNDPSLPQNLADIQIAVVKTLQTLFRETNGAYPKEITNFYLIQESLSQEGRQKVAKDISPKFKEILNKELLKPEFNDIRHLITIEGEAVFNKKEQEKLVVESVSHAQGCKI